MKNVTLLLFVIVLATLAGFATWWSVRHATPAAMPVVLDAPAETRGASIAPTTATNSSAEARKVTRQFLDANASGNGASIGVPCRIEGRALDTRGAPVARADVTVSTRAETWRAIADPDGRFGVDAFLTESGNLVLELAGDPWLARTHWTLDVTPEAGDFVLVEGRNDVGNLLLEDRGAIEGRVLDATQQPVSGARVVVTFEVGGDEEAATTDAKGFYRIGGLPGGERMMLASGDGWAPMQPTPIHVVVRETTRVADVLLRALPSIRGVVVDEQGVPAVGAVIEGREDPDVTGVTALSGAGGAFVLWLDRAVPHHVVIVPNEEYALPLATIEALAATSTIDVKGKPTSTLRPPPSTTEVAQSSEPIAAGRDDVRLVVHRRFQVTFRVVDGTNGRPIETFGLGVERASTPWTAPSSDGPCELHSRGELRCVATPGTSYVSVWAPDCARWRSLVTIDEGATDVQTIAMVPGARIRGRATIRGEPIAGVQLTLRRESRAKGASTPGRDPANPANSIAGDGPNVRRVELEGDDAYDVPEHAARASVETSAANGGFEFRDLTAGTYTLSTVHKDAAPTIVGALHVDTGGVLNLGDVALIPAASIRGRLIPPSDEKASGFIVYLNRTGPSRIERSEVQRSLALRRADGAFEFGGLVPGSWRVDWSRASAPSSEGDLAIHAGVEATLEAGDLKEIVLDASNFSPSPLEVRVVRGREPVAGAHVYVSWVREESIHSEPGVGWHGLTSRTASLGTTDATGSLSTTIESGVAFRLEAYDANGILIARPPELHTAVSRQWMHCTIDGELGKLVLELPPDAASTPDAQVVVEWTTTGLAWKLLVLRPAQPGDAERDQTWHVGENALGGFAPGEYSFRVNFLARETETPSLNSKRSDPLRPPYRTRVTVVAGQEARIVVP